jgi:hypothetical protein
MNTIPLLSLPAINSENEKSTLYHHAHAHVKGIEVNPNAKVTKKKPRQERIRISSLSPTLKQVSFPLNQMTSIKAPHYIQTLNKGNELSVYGHELSSSESDSEHGPAVNISQAKPSLRTKRVSKTIQLSKSTKSIDLGLDVILFGLYPHY